MKSSAEILQQFLQKEYIDNPEMDSPDMSSAIRDLLTDLMHLGDMFDVQITSRVFDAHEVYEQEITNELQAKTGVAD